jgi:transcriptional regulator with XRE-family HTH domain
VRDVSRSRNSELTARVRAAWAFSGLSQADLAQRAGINSGTLRGYLRKANPNAPELEDAKAIADACGVPRSFMEEGFGEPPAGLAAQLQEMQTRLDAVVVLLPILLDATGFQLPADGVQALERALGRPA